MKSKPYDMLYQIIVCLYILYAYMYDMCLYMFIRLLSRILLIITNHHYIYYYLSTPNISPTSNALSLPPPKAHTFTLQYTFSYLVSIH